MICIYDMYICIYDMYIYDMDIIYTYNMYIYIIYIYIHIYIYTGCIKKNGVHVLCLIISKLLKLIE